MTKTHRSIAFCHAAAYFSAMKIRISRWSVFVALSAMLTASVAWSAEVVTRIHAVQPALDGVAQVLSTVDGRVYDVSAENAETRAFLEQARASGRPVRLELDAEEVSILSATAVSVQDARLYQDDLMAQPSASDEVEKLLFPLPTDYEPSIYTNLADIERLFHSMTTRTRGSSQCYQRASYWTYHLQQQFGTRSMKVFLFFTEAYRSMQPPRGKPAHRWWFHVAPMVYYQDPSGQITEMVLDRGWPATITRPQRMKEWSDVFVDTYRECRVIDSYAEVNAQQEEWRRDGNRVRREAYRREHCLLRIVPMYYYQPVDIEALDLQGVRQHSWSRYALGNHGCAVNFCF